MQIASSNHKSARLSLRPILETIYESDALSEDSSFDHSKSPKTRKRGSTVGYETPTPKTRHNSKHFISTHPSENKELLKIHQQNKNDDGRIFFEMNYAKLKTRKAADFNGKQVVSENHRAKMLDWMLEVLRIFKQNEATFYKAVRILDLFYAKTAKTQRKEDLHLNGLVSMFIASKSEQSKYVKLTDFIKIVGKNKFSRKEILLKELEILKAIGFRTNSVGFFDILCVSAELLFIKDEVLKKNFLKAFKIVSKISVFSVDILRNFTIGEISAVCLIIGVKLAAKVRSVSAGVYVGLLGR